MNLSRKFIHSITVWSNPVSNGYGKYTFDAPVLLDGRWEDRAELFINAQTGREEVSRSVAFFDGSNSVGVGDMIALGDHTATASPYNVSTARTVRSIGNVPSIRGDQALLKAIV